MNMATPPGGPFVVATLGKGHVEADHDLLRPAGWDLWRFEERPYLGQSYTDASG